MKCILERTDPLINCYPNYGHIFSIVGKYTQNYLPWIFNHFVQLYAPKGFKHGIRADFATPELFKSFPWIDTDHISRTIVKNKWDNILDFVKEYINNGYYIYTLLDVSKISFYKAQTFWCHDPLIYGYNDEKQLIYFADNYKNGKYLIGQTSYKELIEASLAFDNNTNVVDFLKGHYCIKYRTLYDFGNCRFADDYCYKFNRELFFNLIEDYLCQRNSFKRWSSPQNLVEEEDDNVWGIGIYPFLQSYLDYVKKTEIKIDLRSFYVLCEHKKLLKKIFDFLVLKENYIIPKNCVALFEECIVLGSTICNLCLKYNLSSKGDIIEKIKDRILKLEEKEKNLLSLIL